MSVTLGAIIDTNFGAVIGTGFGAIIRSLNGILIGLIVGLLIPTSLRMSAHTEGMPVLDALVMGRFETAILSSFLLAILATIVGAWIGGRNLIPRNLRKE